jgi:hypothetical protein
MTGSVEFGKEPDFEAQLQQAVHAFSEVMSGAYNTDNLNATFGALETVVGVGVQNGRFTSAQSFEYLSQLSEQAAWAATLHQDAQTAAAFTTRQSAFNTALNMLGKEQVAQQEPTNTSGRNMGGKKDQ